MDIWQFRRCSRIADAQLHSSAFQKYRKKATLRGTVNEVAGSTRIVDAAHQFGQLNLRRLRRSLMEVMPRPRLPHLEHLTRTSASRGTSRPCSMCPHPWYIWGA